MTAAARRFLRAGGHRLEYQWLAPLREGLPALVFLHQGLGSISMWRDFPAQLAARTGCGTLVYSRYGHGHSDVVDAPRPIDFMEREGGVVLPEVLRALDLHDVVLIGHSDGGTAALVYAGQRYPVRALVVVAPHIRTEEVTHAAIVKQKKSWHGSVLRERLARHHRDADRMFQAWTDVWERLHACAWSIEPVLASITCPILAIQGLQDTHGTMMQIERIAALASGTVTLERLDQCGHDPFRDQTARVLDLLSDFVARHVGDLTLKEIPK